MSRAWHDRLEKMDSRRFAPAGFRRARSDALRCRAAHRPMEKGGRRPGGPGGPQIIARTVRQRASEGRKLEMIGAGRKREAGADHSGAQTACTRQPGGKRASTGLRAVELKNGAFGGAACGRSPSGYRANYHTRTKRKTNGPGIGEDGHACGRSSLGARCVLRSRKPCRSHRVWPGRPRANASGARCHAQAPGSA